MTPDILIKGERFLLRPFTEDDIETKVSWLTDYEIKNSLILQDEITPETTLKWFNNSKTDPTRMDFTIETNDGEKIGTIGLRKISQKQCSACIYIIIGNKKYWGKGVMFETECLLIDWAFNSLGLEKIWADVRQDNIASIITMKKIGFKADEALKKEEIVNGQKLNILRYNLSREDFKAPHKQSNL